MTQLGECNGDRIDKRKYVKRTKMSKEWNDRRKAENVKKGHNCKVQA